MVVLVNKERININHTPLINNFINILILNDFKEILGNLLQFYICFNTFGPISFVFKSFGIL